MDDSQGEVEPGEDLLRAAEREFEEETGVTATGPYTALTPIMQKGGENRSRLGVL